ncbi:MAG: LPXTG cell wall anchor domain-containing protein [Acidimicrobiia bacterium]
MQRTATTIGLGLAGAVTVSLAFAPSAFATGDTPVEQPTVEQEQAPFLDLLYAAPHMNLVPGDTTTVVIAQTLPASYTLTSYLANGNKCFYAYDAPAADHVKSGTESDADRIERWIVATSDANGNGVDDWYEGAADENGVAACKIKATDEFGNMDWKYIYINVGVPKTPKGEDFDTGATTVVDPPATTAAPATTAPATNPSVVVPSSVLPTTVAPATSAPTTATLPRTGSATWVEALLGVSLAAAGAGLLTFSRRRAQAAEVRSNG